VVVERGRAEERRPALGDEAEEPAFLEDTPGGLVRTDAQRPRRVPAAPDLRAGEGPRPPRRPGAPVGVPGEDAGELQDGTAAVGAELGNGRIGENGAEPAALIAGTLRPGRDRPGDRASAGCGWGGPVRGSGRHAAPGQYSTGRAAPCYRGPRLRLRIAFAVWLVAGGRTGSDEYSGVVRFPNMGERLFSSWAPS
jgi:hypothetical protein